MSGTVTINCRKCRSEIDNRDVLENNAVKCFLCSSHFHNECRNITKDLNKLIKDRVIFLICDLCEIRFSPTVSSSSGSNPTPKRDTTLKKNVTSSRKKEICWYFLKGYCKYGDECRFGHTKICWKLIRTGKCLDLCVNRLFHEHVCEDSKTSRMCPNQECEKYHISGTRRKERVIDPDSCVNENATHADDIANQTASLETDCAVAGRPAWASREEYPDLPHRGEVQKSHVFTERDVANVPHRVQSRPGYAHIVKTPRQTGLQESNQVKTLNDKMAQHQSRIQNNEKLIQQLLESNSCKAPFSQENGNKNERNDQTNEGSCFTRIQNTENTVNALYIKLHQMETWLQNFHRPVNPQSHPIQNAQCQTQTQPDQTHANHHVFHYGGHIPQVIENFGTEGPSYTPL